MKLFVAFMFILQIFATSKKEQQERDLDYEIFHLTDSLRKLISPTADFYSILGVDRTANEKEITKAYRKKSLQYHPDKNPTEEAKKLYKLLTSISATLKNVEQRGRYDMHLARGFPVWRGTGYYYAFFEPGLGFVFGFILTTISVAQYIIRWIYYRREVAAVTEENDKIANMTPMEIKKELQLRAKEDPNAQKFNKKDLKNITGVDLFGLVQNPPRPKITDLVLFSLPMWIFNKITMLGGKSKSE